MCMCLCQCRRIRSMWGIMQTHCSICNSQIRDCKPSAGVTSCCTCCTCQMKTISMPLCFFFSSSSVFSLSLHASMSVALPTGSWFMNPIQVCHYCLQKGALMDQYVESVSRRIASCPQTSWIFFWQPVACSISELMKWNDILRCCGKFGVISFCW